MLSFFYLISDLTEFVIHAFKFPVLFMLVLVDFRSNAHSSVYDWKLIFVWQINYAHIKACLVMQSSGISPEGLLGSHPKKKTDESTKKEEPSDIEMLSNEVTNIIPSTEEIPMSIKRQKVCEFEEESQVPVKATATSLVEWLEQNDGVREMKSQISVFA